MVGRVRPNSYLRSLHRLTLTPLRRSVVLAAIVLPYAYVSLAPNPSWPGPRPNAARWTDGGGLRFPEPGRALTLVPPPWLTQVKHTNWLQVDLRIKPARAASGTILTISDDRLDRNLSIEQRRRDLIVRLRNACEGYLLAHWTCSVSAYQRDVLEPGTWTVARVRVVPGRLTVLIRGERVVGDGLGAKPLMLWEETHRLALGNEITGTRPWLGEIENATVRTPGFVGDYVDPAKVEIDTPLRPLDRVELVPFASFSTKDVARNAIMYMPMGVAFAVLGLFRGRATAVCAALTMATISLAMETAQVFLPGRSPSVNDLLLNATGGTLGFLAACWLCSRLPTRILRLRVGERANP